MSSRVTQTNYVGQAGIGIALIELFYPSEKICFIFIYGCVLEFMHTCVQVLLKASKGRLTKTLSSVRALSSLKN